MSTVLYIVNTGSKETFCHDCGQLRLWLKGETPTCCGNCKSNNIIVGELNSDELTKAKEEWLEKNK